MTDRWGDLRSGQRSAACPGCQLQDELDTSRRVIEVQGKLYALLEQLATGGATDEDRAK